MIVRGMGNKILSAFIPLTIIPLTQSDVSMPAGLMFLNVFLLQAQLFWCMKYEHFHAHIGRHVFASRLAYHDHQRDRQRHSPDGGLLAEDTE